jgi:hypothetical protein
LYIFVFRNFQEGNLNIDLEEAEDRYGLEPVEGLTPEKIFDARWAIALLGEAMNRLSRDIWPRAKKVRSER